MKIGILEVFKVTCKIKQVTRLSAAFISTASGLKHPIFLIAPRKTDLPDGKNCLFQMNIRIQNIITCVLQVMLIV